MFLTLCSPLSSKGIGQLVTDLVAHHPGNADPARLCQCFQTRCDIDPVAKNVVVVGDDVAEIDADPKPDAAIVGSLWLAVEHPALYLGGATHRVDDAGEFREHAVAGVFDDVASVLLDLRID